MTGSRARPDDFGIGRLFSLIAEGIIAADLSDERIVLWNPAATAILGYEADEAVGMRLDALVPPDLRDQHLAGIRRYRGGAPATLVGQGPVVVPALAKDGSTKRVALSLTNISTGGSTVVLAILRDVTAQWEAERDLEAANSAMRRFVATASHDLRTPLATLLGLSRAVASAGDSMAEDQRRMALEAMVRAAEQASRLVTDLLTLSQIQAHAVQPVVSAVDVAEAVGEAVAATAAGADIDVEVEPGLVVDADADHLRRMLENYLTNAQRYGRPPIRITATSDGAFAEIRVSDAGDGVPPEHVDSLFQSFARFGASRSDSTGLGLSIAQGLAEAVGGSTFYDRPPDGPTTFGVRLPLTAG